MAGVPVRVQRVASPDADEQSWTVLGDDWLPVEPVESFLAHLTDQRPSPNTVKAYAHDLNDYFDLAGREGATHTADVAGTDRIDCGA